MEFTSEVSRRVSYLIHGRIEQAKDATNQTKQNDAFLVVFNSHKHNKSAWDDQLFHKNGGRKKI